MRVTHKMMSDVFLADLANVKERMQLEQHRLSTGRKFDRASQDPIGTKVSMDIATKLGRIERHIKNAEEAKSILEVSESYVSHLVSNVQRVRELLLQANTDTITVDQREHIAQELEQIRNHLIDIANAKYGDRHLFGGQMTLNPPFVVDPADGSITYHGDSSQIGFEIDEEAIVPVNTPGDVLFGSVFDDLEQIVSRVRSGEDLDLDIELIDRHFNHFLNVAADLGSRMNRVEMTLERLQSMELTFKKFQAENEQVDLAEAIINLKMDETTYRSALAVGARTMQPSLIDYLV